MNLDLFHNFVLLRALMLFAMVAAFMVFAGIAVWLRTLRDTHWKNHAHTRQASPSRHGEGNSTESIA